MLEIPDLLLHFLWDACLKGYSGEIRRLVAGEPKDPRRQFFTAVRERRDYPNLYPFKKWPGTSQEFYEFYQNLICGWSAKALAVAKELARLVGEGADAKRLKELRKPEAFKMYSGRNAIRRLIVDHLELEEYDSLFPSEHHPVRVRSDGWNLLRFYVGLSKAEQTPLPEGTIVKTTHAKILLIADEYFNNCGPKRVKNVLDRMSRGKAGLPWLREMFCEMAETHPEFQLADWEDFICDEDGHPVPYEALFQIRLRLANLYRQSQAKKEENLP